MIERFTGTVLLLLLVGCQSVTHEIAAPLMPVSPSQIIIFSDPDLVKEALHEQLGKWQSVRYKRGGLSKKGIDCSGFVYLTYLSEFGIRIPRTTDLQSSSGMQVSEEDLIAGDLVFFKTGFSTLHVGIYIEDGKFIHASKSGVRISRLDNDYWSERYWKSIRISI